MSEEDIAMKLARLTHRLVFRIGTITFTVVVLILSSTSTASAADGNDAIRPFKIHVAEPCVTARAGDATADHRLQSGRENARIAYTGGVSVPTAFTVFPGEIYRAPRTWVERTYRNLIYFNEGDKGGHSPPGSSRIVLSRGPSSVQIATVIRRPRTSR
jgi:hypothetical protein